MRLLADENIPDELAELLLKAGHDVLTPVPRSKDDAIFALAKKQRRAILTQDKDFANILSYPPKLSYGIIRLKFHPPVISEIFSRLDGLFRQYSQRDIKQKLIILEKDGIRIR